MNLKNFLAESGRKKSLPATTVPAPELGEGVSIPVALLTLGEMKACAAIRDDKSGNSLAQLQAVLAIVIVDENGNKVYAEGDPAMDAIPAPLGFRLIEAALTASTASMKVNDAKKSSKPILN